MHRDEHVMICCADIAGQVRGKGFPARDLEARLARGIGWTPANILIHAFEGIADDFFGPWGDLILMPDRDTRVNVDFGDGSPPEFFFLSDVLETDCRPWENCPRLFLRRALDRLERTAGLRLVAALEHEFVYSGAERNLASAFNLGSVRRAGEFGPAYLHALRMGGIDVDSYLPEFGPQQYEVTHRPQPAVRAADHALIVRELARATAHRLGHRVTFAPMPTPEGVGNGVHIHMSLWDRSGKPVSWDAGRPHGLSAVMSAFAAGILQRMPALCAVTAPSVCSYLRLHPHRWSASYTNFGFRDREAGLRIAPVFETPGADVASQYNIEYRAADATANPYLALGVLVHAGIEGIERNLSAPEPVRKDPEKMDAEERRRLGIVRLPTSLSEALAAFEADATIKSWFPPELHEAYLRYKRWEIATLGALEPAEQCARYSEAY